MQDSAAIEELPPEEESNDIVNDLEITSEAKDVNKRLLARPVVHLGDYVEIFQNGQYSGVVVGQRKASGGRQVLTVLLRNGKTKEFNSTTVAFIVPRFLQEDVRLSNFRFDPLAESMPDNYPIPAFSRRVFDYQRTIQLRKGLGLKGLSKVYDHFIQQAKSTTDTVTVSIDDLAKVAYATAAPTSEQRHATFLYLIDDNIHYTPATDMSRTQQWTLRSVDAAEELSQIIESIRQRSSQYTKFLKIAKGVLDSYNSHADPVMGTVSPTSKLILDETRNVGFEPMYRKYINFIADWVKTPRTGIHSPHEVFAPTILKGLGAYDNLFIDRLVAIQFLKQVGMLKPWDNITLFQNAAAADDFFWSDKATKMDDTMQHHANIYLEGKLDQSDFYARDPCDAIRHDFGDMPVYTIDDSAAKEIDDGISIERIPGQDAAWIHIHIADPSAYIPPTHELAMVMQQRGQTLYLPERHYPILPTELSSNKFSLGSTAQTNSDGSQYALTFSARLDHQGDLHEWKVRPSLVKNIQKMYYNDVDAYLEPHAASTIPSEPLVDFSKKFAHPTSIPESPTASVNSTVTSESEQDLLDIFKLTQHHSKFRFQSGALNFVRASPYVDLDPQPLDIPSLRFTKAEYPSTLPLIRVGLENSSASPAKRMVAEAMILGGRVASHYAQEHNVVIPHRTQTWPENATSSDIALRQQMLDDRNPQTGTIGLANVIPYMKLLPPASITSSVGLPHVLMGIPNGYVKATSPLRRYLDIVTHWQLKAHMLKQSAPFTKETLDSLLPRLETQEKRLSFLQQDSLQFWVMEMMRRLIADSHGEDMEWTCIVNVPNQSSRSELGGTMETARVTILELGLKARVQKLNRTLQMGEVVKVRMVRLDQFHRHVDLELV
ncbi:hypothetical protein BJV82DRAFT_645721 [Fennellomyces sp. T-0311]|nr:hypothetical protein BJV82DRAFT_645721 [Fennellomyces sp. T-0311]